MIKNWVSFNVRALLFRSTGLVYIFPYKGGPAEIHPFHEFDAFLNSSSNPKSGFLYHTLFISHRENKELVFAGTDQANESALKESVYL